MNKIKQQIANIRNNTPKRVQWLLMAVAFIVVIILLTLLFGGEKKPDAIQKKEKALAELKIVPDMVNWADIKVGEKKTETIKISATAPAKIFDVRWHDETITGLDIKETCKKMGQINPTLACALFVTFTPTTAMATKNVPVFVDWYDAEENESMKKTDKIILTLGAVVPELPKKPEPKPVVIPEPEPEPEPEPDPEPEPEPEPIKQEIIREVEMIAPPIVEPEPVVEEIIEETYEIPDGCTDFAFPGYNNAGRQIGWIKPARGAYYFHPFADKDCSEPTGKYNPTSGIITDIDNPSKRIGTDADHIGFAVISGGVLPELSNAPAIKKVNRAEQLDDVSGVSSGGMGRASSSGESIVKPAPKSAVLYETTDEDVVTSSAPYDRTFVLRQYKPIPATIVSDVRADIEALQLGVPVRATVDRNVYSDNGRTVVIPTGTLLLGYVTGEVPGPYKAIGRMNIKWYQFIRPDGVEFNFPTDSDPYSADAQGRVGVPGRGSTDYLEQFFMPMLTAFVPATINLINPIADAFVNQIDLDNNTVVQSGTIRSSELAKNEIITAWNQVAQKLLVDMMDNTVPPFTIAAGTRITVYSPVDLQITCGDPDDPDNIGKKCAVAKFNDAKRRSRADIEQEALNLKPANDDSWTGQSRSFAFDKYCEEDDKGLWRVREKCSGSGDGKLNDCGGHSYSTLKMYCDSLNYQSKKALQYEAYTEDQKKQYDAKVEELGGAGSKEFNEQILGIQYNEDGTVKNPYETPKKAAEEEVALTCEDGNPPDANGCCAGETYTDMGDQGFNCCPDAGGDCFPPII